MVGDIIYFSCDYFCVGNFRFISMIGKGDYSFVGIIYIIKVYKYSIRCFRVWDLDYIYIGYTYGEGIIG